MHRMNTLEFELTRRDAMKIFCAALLGTAAWRIDFSSVTARAEAYDRLEILGLHEYKELYDVVFQYRSMLGCYPRVWQTHVIEPLQNVADGVITNRKDPSIVALRDGFGARIGRLVGDARDAVDRTNITIESTDGVTEDEVRQFLVSSAEHFPFPAVCMSRNIRVWSAGGESGLDHVAITSPRNMPSAPVTWYHEGVHSADRICTTRSQYLEKHTWIRYVTTYLQGTLDLVNSWVTVPDIMKYLGTGPLMSIKRRYSEPILPGIQLDDLHGQIRQIGKSFGVDIQAQQGITSEFVTYEWNMLIHAVLRTMLSLSLKDRDTFKEGYKNELQALFTWGIMARSGENPPYFEGLLSNIEHYLVGPVQAVGGGIPMMLIETPDDYITQMNIALQIERLAVYSTFPRPATLSDMRRAFGLETAEEYHQHNRVVFGGVLAGSLAAAASISTWLIHQDDA